jgi:hypothetical protein
VLTNLSDDDYIFNATAVDHTGNVNYTATRNVTIAGHSIKLRLTNITFSSQNVIEGQIVTAYINISNTGVINATNATVELNISLWNTSKNILTSYNFTYVNITNGSSIVLEYNWTVQVGTFEFAAFADPGNVIQEYNETDNTFAANYSTSSWNIYFGDFAHSINLADGANNKLHNWSTLGFEFNLYYSDTDAVYNYSNLRAFNQTNDFNDSDSALNISGYNDSVRATYDTNSDGVADQTTTFYINGVAIANVPYVNSTNTSSFISGILWDSAEGANYNGTQDLIFVTRVNASNVGYYGTYDYEVRIPSDTRKLKSSADTISQRVEII